MSTNVTFKCMFFEKKVVENDNIALHSCGIKVKID